MTTKHSMNMPSRNAPCVCGSGKKSKHCCGAAAPVQNETGRKPWLLVASLLGVIGIAIYAVSVNRPSSVSDTAKSPPVSASAPLPWQYDAVSNQHWDPSHKHWHQGRPPGSAAPAAPVMPAAPPASAAGTGTAPKPWQYDAANNRHWNPTHQHWHGGPPPSQAPRP
ncbi:MAG: motif [Abditibacteriota bacterium]|nr:motif [Abditibacteriota bacterium]